MIFAFFIYYVVSVALNVVTAVALALNGSPLCLISWAIGSLSFLAAITEWRRIHRPLRDSG